MSDRNTSVRASQIRNLTLTGEDIANTSISGSTKLIDGSVPESKLDIDNSPTDGYTLIWNDAAGKMKWEISSTTDHGTLDGLTDDDHSQYLLTNGNRQLTGTWNFGSQTISGTGDFHTTGSIGAGITPAVQLHSYGTGELLRIQDSSATGNPYMSFYQDSTRKAYIQYADSGDQFVFDSDGLIQFNSSNTNAVTIDASQNVGIGTTTIPIWDSSYDVLQLGANTSLGNTGAYTLFSNNCYESSGGWKHINAGTASYYRQYSGEHQFVVDSTNPGADGAMTRTYAMTIDSSGKVGIGTTDPSQLLDVNGGDSASATVIIQSSLNTGYAQLNLTEDGGSGALLVFGSSYSSSGAFEADGMCVYANDDLSGGLNLVARHASGEMGFFTGGMAAGNERMHIDSSGNVGIGTASPGTMLELYNSGDSSELIRIDTNRASENDAVGGLQFQWNNNTIAAIYGLAGPDTGNKDDGKLTIQTAAPGGGLVDRLRIDENGYVGINTAGSTDALLHIEHASSPQFKIEYTSGYHAILGCGSANFYINDSTGNPRFQLNSTSTVFNEDGSDIDFRVESDVSAYGLFLQGSDGFVGVGTGSPSYPLDVENNRASNYVMRIYNAGDDANRYGLAIQAGANDGSGTTYFILAKDGNGTETGQIKSVNGTFTLTDTSDERLKCNIEDAQINGIEIINGLRVREFNWNKNPEGPKVIGFIAQELQEVYSEAVSAGDSGMLGISKEALVMPLIKAVQEQQIIIEDLISRIELLEGS